MIKILFCVFSLFFQVPDNEEYVVKVYSIQDLEMNLPNYMNAPEFDLQAALNHQGSLFKDNTSSNFSAKKEYQIIIEIIEQNIEPDIWLDGATIKYWKGNLIIRAPQRIHDQLK